MNLYKMIPKVDQILDNKVIKDLLEILYQIRLKI